VAALALVVIGACWIGALSTLNASMQLFLPSWVRARGLAYYLMVFQGGQAFGALAWGVLAQHVGLVRAGLAAAAWSLYQDPADPGVLLEAFQVRSWSEHLAQHHVRYTGVDHAFEEQARGLTEGEPRVRHVVALEVGR
jgi:hypothetical protein